MIDMEHTSTNKGGAHSVIGEMHSAKNRFRLADRIVIQQERVVAFPGLDSFKHAS